MPATNTPAVRLRGPYTDVPTHFARSLGVIGCAGKSCARTTAGAPMSETSVESAANNFIVAVSVRGPAQARRRCPDWDQTAHPERRRADRTDPAADCPDRGRPCLPQEGTRPAAGPGHH